MYMYGITNTSTNYRIAECNCKWLIRSHNDNNIYTKK